jgi:histidyl-tRNA synthetase
VALDKLDKVGREGVDSDLAARGISEQDRVTLLDLFVDSSQEIGPLASGLVKGDPIGSAALQNLQQIRELVSGTKAEGRLRIDISLARGLSYYTGAIMEITVPDLSGSLGGGGRYDNLVGMFLGQSIPACGFSLGLERILVVMGERGMFPPTLATTPADVMVAVFDAADMPHAMRVAARLREAGLRVMVYPDADKIGRQIKYADSRGIPCVALLGSDEIATGTITVKHLAAQTQSTYDQAAAGAAILEALQRRG